MNLRPARCRALLSAGALLCWVGACGGSTMVSADDGGPGGDTDAGGDASLGDGADGSPPVWPYTVEALVNARIGSENSAGWPNVGEVYADFDWKQGPFAAVTLIVDLDTS